MSTLEMTYNSKAVRLSRQMVEEFRRRDYGLGMRLPAEMDLAEEFQVSRSTIRRALGLLADGGQVVRVPRKGVVVGPGIAGARTLAQIAFVANSLDPDTDVYAQGLGDALDPDRFALAIYSAHADHDRYRRLVENVARTRPAGVVLTVLPRELCRVDWRPLIESNIPIVALGRIDLDAPELTCDSVAGSGTKNAERIARFVVERGCRDLAYFATAPRRSSERSIATLRRELAPFGITLPEDKVFVFDSPRGYQAVPDPYIDARDTMVGLLREGFRCRLLIAGTDYQAVGAVWAILDAGIKIPDEMAVISTLRCPGAIFSPRRLTTIDQNLRQQGTLALRLLMRRIEGYAGPIEVHHASADLIQGETA